MRAVEDDDRKVIPRWRALQTTLKRHELGPLSARHATEPHPDESFAKKVRDWQSNRSFSFAADVVSSSLVLGREGDARDAAEFVLHNAPSGFTAAISLANRVLGIEDSSPEAVAQYRACSGEDEQMRIARLRRMLQVEPRNAFLWVELARCYEIVGLPAKARAAIRPALALAPVNRYVLRSASRLCVHQDDFERAHDVLVATPILRHDPWVLAAEIAVAACAHRSSKNIKEGRRLLEARRLAPVHLSELASAVGTLDVESGNTRRGRRLFRQSLEEPSENSIAQAAWVGRRFAWSAVPEELLQQNLSYEAEAWRRFFAGQWVDALNAAKGWLDDQPFSARPAYLGSYVASVCLGDFEAGAAVAQCGLRANPNDFVLRNNRAFSLAQADKADEAKRVFDGIDERNLATEDRIVWYATRGLLLYRTGNGDAGRAEYRKAIDLAHDKQNMRRRALALAFLALEEHRIGSAETRAYQQQALTLLASETRPDFGAVRERLSALALA